MLPIGLTLNHMLDMAHAQAERVLVGTSEDLMPVFLFINGKGESGVIGAPFRSTIEKDMVADAARKLFADKQAVAYSFLSEAWMASVKHQREYDGPPPSALPDRIEVVMALAETATEMKSRMWKIVRGEGNVCIRLENMGEVGDAKSLSGRFSGLLASQTRH